MNQEKILEQFHYFNIHADIDSVYGNWAVSTDGDVVKVVFESKDGNTISAETVKHFCNELVDQQVRYNINLQFGHIRDLIVEEAFKPVNK